MQLYATYEEARAIVLNMISCSKVIISAINGVAVSAWLYVMVRLVSCQVGADDYGLTQVGAGCALALMADITIASDKAKLGDG